MKKAIIVGIVLILLSSIPVNTYSYEKTKEANFMNGSNNGKTLYVGGSGPNNYTSIQDAINAANNGDTIFVYSGTYNESVIINKSITLIGENGDTTIIHAEKGYAINLTGSLVNIENFTIINGRWEDAGMIIYKSMNNLISHCKFYKNEWSGIEIYFSNKNRILNCTFESNIVGIELRYSFNNIVSNCSISHGGDGINIMFSDSNTISNCRIYKNNWDGVSLEGSSNNKVTNNVFVSNGISIGGNKPSHFIHEIYNNTINGLPLIYIKNENNIILKNVKAGEIIIVNCRYSEIRNVSINNSGIGIEIAYCNNIIISNCNISNTYEGILLLFSSNNILSNNYISQSNESGISLNTCDNNIIIGNRVANTYNDAIFLWDSCYNNISSNEITENGGGVLVFSYSDYNIVYGNYVAKNNLYGISIQGGSFNKVMHNVVRESKYWCGISTAKSWTCNNIISYNEVMYNNWVGIEIEGAGNIICNNNISHNTQCGIYLSSFLGTDCKRNVIKENNFIENGVNAEFDVKLLSLNIWLRNYWSDWRSFFPKPIHGKCIIFSMPMFRIRIPWLNFDWMPSLTPYK